MHSARAGAVALTLATLVSIVASAWAEPPGGTSIVVRRGAGPVELGMNDAAVRTTLGLPTTTGGFVEDSITYRYADFTLWMKKGRLQRLDILNSRYQFSNGVGVGSPEIDVRAAFGVPTRVLDGGDFRTLQYIGKGYEFTVDAKGVVTIVVLFWQ